MQVGAQRKQLAAHYKPNIQHHYHVQARVLYRVGKPGHVAPHLAIMKYVQPLWGSGVWGMPTYAHHSESGHIPVTMLHSQEIWVTTLLRYGCPHLQG